MYKQKFRPLRKAKQSKSQDSYFSKKYKLGFELTVLYSLSALPG